MIMTVARKYKSMILVSVFFFYLGCVLTLSLLRIDCVVDAGQISYEDTSSINDIEYAVLIMSGPDNEVKRDAIRMTWCKFINNIFTDNGEKLYKWNHTRTTSDSGRDFAKCYFVIGTQNLNRMKFSKLGTEQSNSHDLLLLDDFEDSYSNLASKLISSLKWFNQNLRKIKYVIKCDDDSFVRIDLIIKDLEAYAPKMSDPYLKQFISTKNNLQSFKGLYWGYFNGKANVYLKGKWQEKDWFLCDKYLPYALGGGYVISKSIVDYVARNANLLSHYNSEDVSLGVWTAALDSINRVHDIRFDTEWKSRGCSDNLLVRHKQNSSDMFHLYRTLVQTQGAKMCKTESVDRQSYLYKWDVLPSACCK